MHLGDQHCYIINNENKERHNVLQFPNKLLHYSNSTMVNKIWGVTKTATKHTWHTKHFETQMEKQVN